MDTKFFAYSTVILKGDPKDIMEALTKLKIPYGYDAGDYYISTENYSIYKNDLAYYGVI